MSTGYQAGGITAVGSTSLLVNFTVFRHNNGSQVQSCAPNACIKRIMTFVAAVAVSRVPFSSLRGEHGLGKLQIHTVTLQNPALYAILCNCTIGCLTHFLCLCAAPGVGRWACHHRCCHAHAHAQLPVRPLPQTMLPDLPLMLAGRGHWHVAPGAAQHRSPPPGGGLPVPRQRCGERRRSVHTEVSSLQPFSQQDWDRPNNLWIWHCGRF